MSGGERVPNQFYFVLEFIIVAIVGLIAGAAVGYNYLIRPLDARERARIKEITEAQIAEAHRLKEDALKEVEASKRQALLDAKEEALQLRTEVENENREKRAEIQRLERRLAQKEESLDRRAEGLELKERQLQAREAEVARVRQEAWELRERQEQELQRLSGLTAEEARSLFLKAIEDDCRHEAAKLIRDIEEAARRDGEHRARRIVTDVIQRCSVDQTSETTVSVVPLPNDEMKGRIIGREGRNIRAFETLTGVDLIIDDTPEAVVLSGFDPVRREVARIALTNLIVDGRIHPGRIEEVVARARQEVDAIVREAGERAAMEANVHGLQPELLKILGRLHFRTSYGQNVLAHSVEVSILAATIAHELGADVNVCKTAALLHDMGKAIDQEVEGPHAIVGGEIARRFGKSPKIIHAMVAHHATEAEPQTLEAAIVQAADAISAARPGARRETVDLYIKRLEALEGIANSFTGVEKSFAIQAGREIRIIVKPEEIDEFAANRLASDIARKIEENLDYPGQIKVSVVRETRAVDYAR